MEPQELNPKISKSILNIPGTIPNVQNGQLLISSGIISLDDLLGGGLPVGTVVLIEEDARGAYSKIVLKYFLAEGIVNKHSIIIASRDCDATPIMHELPAVIATDPEPAHNSETMDALNIAFRYKHLPTKEKKITHKFGHYYDLTKVMQQNTVDSSNVDYWNGADFKEDLQKNAHNFTNSLYYNLLQNIKRKIKAGQFSVKDKPTKRSVLRIGLHSLGSPMWLPNEFTADTNKSKDLEMFLYCLRALVRSAFAIAVVTIPSHLIHKSTIDRCIYSSDVAIKLQAFAGTELENNPILSDYHGYFHLVKLAAINTFVSKHPGSVEYTFKLRRKKFCIEKLHLPPDFAEPSDNEKEVPTMGCGSSTKHLLEF